MAIICWPTASPSLWVWRSTDREPAGCALMPARPQVARVAVPVPVPRLFEYLPAGDDLPAPGSRVIVPFGRRRLVGLVVDQGPASPEHVSALRPIERLADPALVNPALLELVLWCARYYGFAPGEAVNLLLPGALRRVRAFRPPAPSCLELTEAGRRADLARAPAQAGVRAHLEAGPAEREQLLKLASAAVLRQMAQRGLLRATAATPPADPDPGPELNQAQRAAVAAILGARRRYQTFLLAGVTGSGKTEVYLQAARGLLGRDRQVLIVVPEIGLTPQLVRRFERRLGHRVHVYHSDLGEGERLACWQAAGDGSARVIVGTRSAVFLPLRRPGLFVVDEEHDASLKQAETPRYHGRDVAVLRARRCGIPVVLGSATPALESLHNARTGRYRKLVLGQRAGLARQPRWRVIDARGGGRGLNRQLVETVRRHLDQGGQVLLYRNRRGYAPVLMCGECGWQADCERCSAHLTWHRHRSALQCHHCGAQRRAPARCPDCGSPDLLGLGSGTERLEQQIREQLSDVPVYRVDRDTMTRRGQFDQLLAQVRAGEPCVLIGTQMLAKGHHLPGVTLAAVLDVDQALFSADFRAPERLGQAVCQVAGRSGRGDTAGEFLLLTRHPEHPLLVRLRSGDYLDFADCLLAERRQAELPPYTALALLRAEAHQPEPARAFLDAASRALAVDGLSITGPLPAVLSRRGGYWRFYLWIQARNRTALAAAIGKRLCMLHDLPAARKARWHLDMDPVNL